jgi:hypothetical protein
MEEYPDTKQTFIICQTPSRYKLSERIMVLPWQELQLIFENEDLPPHQ